MLIIAVDVVMHLLNTRLWVVRIFKGYFLRQQQQQQQVQQPQPRRLPIMSLGKSINRINMNSPLVLNLVFYFIS